METLFFPLNDRLVCKKQGNQTLDASIKYVAYYHILYSGQSKYDLEMILLKSLLGPVPTVSLWNLEGI